MQPNGRKDTLGFLTLKCCCYSIYYPLRGLYLCCRHAKRTPGRISLAWSRRRARTRKIRERKPIVAQQRTEQEQQKQKKKKKKKNLEESSSPASFLHLPLELRLKIYDLALGEPCLVEPHVGKPEWHPRPCDWQPRQRIRGDDEELQSDELRTVLGVRAWGLLYSRQLRQLPDGSFERTSRHNVPWGWWTPPRYRPLLRTSRAVYSDLLHRLYGENTISLIGAEMVHYFGRNASPEGLRLVRYVHASLVVTRSGWGSQEEQESLEQAVQSLQKLFPALEQLDLNVTIVGYNPVKSNEFWNWLREVLERHLTNLKNFTLRVSTYDYVKPSPCVRRPHIIHQILESWNEDEYQALKAVVCKPSCKG
ncbi:hypothetical protein PG990_005403 [Apiospora arundinis]